VDGVGDFDDALSQDGEDARSGDEYNTEVDLTAEEASATEDWWSDDPPEEVSDPSEEGGRV